MKQVLILWIICLILILTIASGIILGNFIYDTLGEEPEKIEYKLEYL